MSKVHGNSKGYLGEPRQVTHRTKKMQNKKEWQQRRRRDHMAALNYMKWMVGCVDCGTHDERVLDFDHLPQHEKDDNVSSIRGGRWQRISDEIAKCEVRCRNCHHIITQARRDGRLMSATP